MTDSLQYVSFDGYVEYDKQIYYSSNCFNGMIKQLKNGDGIEVIKFPKGIVMSHLLHHRVFTNGNELIFSPDYSYGIHTYDLVSNEMNYYAVKKDEWKNYRCAFSYVWNNKLWMFFAFGENGIASLDLDTHDIQYYPDAYKKLRQLTESNDVVFWSELCIEGSIVYGVINNKNYIVKIDLKDVSVTSIDIGMNAHLSGITVSDNRLYMTEYNTNDVLVYDIQNKETKRLNFTVDSLKIPTNGLMYSNIVSCGGIVLAVHNHLRSVYEITTEGIIKYADFPDNQEDIDTDFRSTYRRFYSTFSDDNKIELYPARSNMMLSIDIVEKKVAGRIFKLPLNWFKQGYEKEIVCDYFEECSTYNVPATESDMCDINDFVNYLIWK